MQTLIRKILSFEVNITHVKFIMYVGSDKGPIFLYEMLKRLKITWNAVL